ncbi:hypothetical protein HYX58_01255 [Candidatus Dependentiae bacterium]|nr:hypothetical protein [Candidatus Dependentiae bacterium]
MLKKTIVILFALGLPNYNNSMDLQKPMGLKQTFEDFQKIARAMQRKSQLPAPRHEQSKSLITAINSGKFANINDLFKAVSKNYPPQTDRHAEFIRLLKKENLKVQSFVETFHEKRNEYLFNEATKNMLFDGKKGTYQELVSIVSEIDQEEEDEQKPSITYDAIFLSWKFDEFRNHLNKLIESNDELKKKAWCIQSDDNTDCASVQYTNKQFTIKFNSNFLSLPFNEDAQAALTHEITHVLKKHATTSCTLQVLGIKPKSKEYLRIKRQHEYEADQYEAAKALTNTHLMIELPLFSDNKWASKKHPSDKKRLDSLYTLLALQTKEIDFFIGNKLD